MRFKRPRYETDIPKVIKNGTGPFDCRLRQAFIYTLHAKSEAFMAHIYVAKDAGHSQVKGPQEPNISVTSCDGAKERRGRGRSQGET
jgi:hypothetical protein